MVLASVKPLERGYNIRVLLVIGMTAFGGLLCALMLKHAGATHGCFSTALSIILTCVSSLGHARLSRSKLLLSAVTRSAMLLQDFTPDLLFVLGTAISVGASFLFALGLPFCEPLGTRDPEMHEDGFNLPKRRPSDAHDPTVSNP